MQLSFNRSHIKPALIAVPVICGFGLGLFDFLEMQEGLRSRDWLPAQGKMLSNTVKAEYPWWRKMQFIPTVEYSYHINDDTALRGYRMSFPDHVPAPEKDLKKLLASLEVGHPVTSYYDPKNVSRVTMIRGVRRAKYNALFLRDALLVLAGGAIWLYTQNSRTKYSNEAT